MENYTLGERKTIEAECPLTFADDAIHMKVTNGSKIKNLMKYAMQKMKDPNTKQISWSGQGHALSKAVSCAEILKRRIPECNTESKGLHQITDVRFNRLEEYWEPKLEGLDRLKMNKEVPAITILLSKDPLDTNDPSYQAPGCSEPFSTRNTQSSTKQSNKWRNRRQTAASGEPNRQLGVPPMERKRKRKGGGQGETSDGPRQDSVKGKNPKDAKSQRGRRNSKGQSSKTRNKKDQDKEDTQDDMDTSASVVADERGPQKLSFSDKLDEITKVT